MFRYPITRRDEPKMAVSSLQEYFLSPQELEEYQRKYGKPRANAVKLRSKKEEREELFHNLDDDLDSLMY